MRHTKFTKTLLAETAIIRRRLVACGTEDGTVKQASSADDKLLGINSIFDVEAGHDVDVELEGAQPVECGAAVAYGDAVTSDADGKAVPATGTNRVIGYAMSSTTASGQLVDVLIDRK